MPLCLAFVLILALGAHALRPGLPRVTWTTSHFDLTIDRDKSHLLPGLAALLEDCHARQKDHFDFDPGARIQAIFLDEEDYANGWAYAAQGWMVVLLHPADFEFRGRTPWLPNVIAHELGHLFTLRKMGLRSRFLGFRLFHAWHGKGGSDFRSEYRYDFRDIPPWLAEGLAQHAARACGYDSLDTRRRMVARTAAAHGDLLSLAEMEAFAWDARRNEMVYTQGFFLVSHLYATRGREAMNRFLSEASGGWKGSFRRAFGIDPEGAYREWREALEREAAAAPARADETDLEAPPAGPDYVAETSPVPLADGSFLFLSSRANDFGVTDLWRSRGGSVRRVFRRATSVTAHPDGSGAVFTAVRHRLAHGGQRSDLYEYEAATGDVRALASEGRITRGMRLKDGRLLALRNEASRSVLLEKKEGRWDTLYLPPDSLELVDAAPGPDDGSVALVTTSAFGGDIHRLDLATLALSPLAATAADEADPAWRGDTLLYVSDAGGRHDVHALHAGRSLRLTREAGGAFRPAAAGGELWYSAYGPRGFTLKRSPLPALGNMPDTLAAEVSAPSPAWARPRPVTVGRGDLDRSGIGLLGYSLSLGLFRLPGYQSGSPGADTVPDFFAYQPGQAAFGGMDLHWLNPAGTLSFDAGLGYAVPVDYSGRPRFDRLHAELRLRSFLPTYVLGAERWARDFPGLRAENAPPGLRTTGYQYLLGTELRLGEHWHAVARGLARGQSWYAYADDRKVSDDGPHFGWDANLGWVSADPGKDGWVSGMSAWGGILVRPVRGTEAPHGYLNIYAEEGFRRLVQVWGFVEQYRELGDSLKAWTYGRAGISARIPLGFKLGPQAGPGLYFDALFPTLEIHGLAIGEPAAGGERVIDGLHARPAAARAFAPDHEPFGSMLFRRTSRELAPGIRLKVLDFFSRPAQWLLGARFDMEDFSREPVWQLRLTL